jgi:hypothetical protein
MIARRADGKLIWRGEPFVNCYGETVVQECEVADGPTGGFEPRKEASPFCESGGRDYCTCDACF